MSHIRNRRRRNIKRGFVSAHTWGPKRAAKRESYRLFWLTTEPRRADERNHAALMRARAEDDARRARKNLKPRDSYWQRLGAIAR